jgi:hypothetical protein
MAPGDLIGGPVNSDLADARKRSVVGDVYDELADVGAVEQHVDRGWELFGSFPSLSQPESSSRAVPARPRWSRTMKPWSRTRWIRSVGKLSGPGGRSGSLYDEISPQSTTRDRRLRRAKTASMISPPTLSKSTSTPCGVAATSRSCQPSARRSPAASKPSRSTSSWHFWRPPAIPTTRAPRSLAIWPATEPTAPAAGDHSRLAGLRAADVGHADPGRQAVAAQRAEMDAR